MADLEKIVEELSKLSVLEAADLVKLWEETWGVSAAAPVAMAAGPAAAAVVEEVEEKTEFDVVIKAFTLTCIPCRVDPRCTAEGRYLEARVVGKDVQSCLFMHISCLEESIFLQGFCLFGNFFRDAQVSKPENHDIAVKKITYLPDFMLIVGCEYKFHKSKG